MKLNLGCGRRILPGYINADLRAGEGVDCVFDAEEGWPFPTASFEEVRASAVFEHLLRWETAILEAARVLKPGGLLDIRVPYGWRGATTAFHLRIFTSTTFDLFTEPFIHRGMDLRLRERAVAATCERGEHGFFRKLRVERWHYFPFAWHLAERIGDWAYRLPFSRTHDLLFLFQRNEFEWEAEE